MSHQRRIPFRRLAVLAASAVVAIACMPLNARSLVDVDLIDRDSGQTLPEYMHRGQVWVPGTPGHRYAVRLTNTSNERVLVVLSVDGVNAVTGETAHPSQTGYVLDPWQSSEIAGWRKSLDDIAQFIFTDLPDSYAARTGRPDHVGVVGIAVFRERGYPRPYPVSPPPIAQQGASRDAAAAAPSASSRASGQAAEAAADSSYGKEAQQRIGTGHGTREWSPVGRTDFVRASRTPSQVMQLRYDDHDSLAALGILPQPYHYGWREAPRAFPNGFVADPD